LRSAATPGAASAMTNAPDTSADVAISATLASPCRSSDRETCRAMVILPYLVKGNENFVTVGREASRCARPRDGGDRTFDRHCGFAISGDSRMARHHPLTRASETTGHEQVYDSRAADRLDVPEGVCGRSCRGFRSAAPAPVVTRAPTGVMACARAHARDQEMMADEQLRLSARVAPNRRQ